MEIQKKILEGALELLTKYGVRSVSMDDVARHVSMSKKTLYQYFKDKDELVYLATKAHLDHEMEEYSEVEKNALNSIDELVQINKCMRKDFRDINPSLLFDLQKFHPKAWNEFLSFKDCKIKSQIINTLKRGINEGFFRKEIDPEVVATMRVEMVQLAFNTQIFSFNKHTLTEIQIMFFDLFVHGILTEEGKKLYYEYLKKTDLT